MRNSDNLNLHMVHARSVYDPVGWLNLGALCLIQGSTFVAMRQAVCPGQGFSPLWMAASRFSTAGVILLAIMAGFGITTRLAAKQLAVALASGVLICGGGTGLASIASKSAGPGLVALFFALSPICAAAMEWAITGRRPSALGVAATLIGAAGVGLFALRMDGPSPGGPTAALLLGPVSYAAGSVLLKHTVLNDAAGATVSLWIVIAWQLVGGSASLWAALLVVGEPLPNPTPTAWMAWAYMTVVSSLAAFSSYLVALRRLPAAVFMSHSWVFPIVAAALGWLVLGERLPVRAYPAGGLILSGLIALVVSASDPVKGMRPAPTSGAAPPTRSSSKAFASERLCESR
jgi:drug/metabolite transporter (DMT)-like permease